MANDTVGTPRKVTLDGITFDVMADTNISEVGSQFENEPVPTSGRTMKKMTRRSKAAESVTLACNGDERQVLEELDERTENFSMSYELASGDVFRAVGFIVFENRETEETRATIQMHPAQDNKWEPFIA